MHGKPPCKKKSWILSHQNKLQIHHKFKQKNEHLKNVRVEKAFQRMVEKPRNTKD